MTDRALLRVESNGPFDHHAAFATLQAHAVDGLHLVDVTRMSLTRLIDVTGQTHQITIGLDPRGASIAVEHCGQTTLHTIGDRVRWWFDLDTDIRPINEHLANDAHLRPLVKHRPGIRITRFHSPFEAVVLTILGQQVSLAAGRLFASRLVTTYGTPLHSSSNLRNLPTPAVLASIDVEQLRATIGLTKARARTLHEVACLFTEITDDQTLPTAAILGAVHGIGPWTLDYLAIRAGNEADAYPATDAVLRRAINNLGVTEPERWSPYRSYAFSRLWAQKS